LARSSARCAASRVVASPLSVTTPSLTAVLMRVASQALLYSREIPSLSSVGACETTVRQKKPHKSCDFSFVSQPLGA